MKDILHRAWVVFQYPILFGVMIVTVWGMRKLLIMTYHHPVHILFYLLLPFVALIAIVFGYGLFCVVRYIVKG